MFPAVARSFANATELYFVRLEVFKVSVGSFEAIGSSLHVAGLPRKVFLLGLSMGGNRVEEARMRERRSDPRRDFTCRWLRPNIHNLQETRTWEHRSLLT